MKIEGVLSNTITVTSGVPQGSVLGPILFLIFINDMCDLFADLNVKYKLFADDLKLYASRTKFEVNNDLTIEMKRIERWCEE